MEFWGVEVKPGGKKVLCKPGEDTYLHVTQAALGESTVSSNQQERVVIKVEVGNKEVVLGTLTQGKCDQMSLDLIFDRDIKLSHTGTQVSVYFCGYQTEAARDEFYTSDDDDDEDDRAGDAPSAIPMAKDNGGPTDKIVVPKLQAGKKTEERVKVPGPTATPGGEGGDDDEDDDEEDYDEEEDDDDEDDEDEDEEDDDMEEDEAKPVSNKRGAPTAAAVVTTNKKAKVAGTSVSKTPEVGKQKGLATPASDGKAKTKKIADGAAKDTPKGKSAKKIGEYKCAPCSKD
eukprot:TRINITY_DN5845_c0_g1_i1.p1 TRINITY_DN5845_c0_g1~~TRINITY_DN5845_c0_g1_i1.p1  ORF type:complete len:287 (+),score=94.69 TRINITY_DN5845_c0_g1_i1:125-985(+)